MDMPDNIKEYFKKEREKRIEEYILFWKMVTSAEPESKKGQPVTFARYDPTA